jgi:hypothetical protein
MHGPVLWHFPQDRDNGAAAFAGMAIATLRKCLVHVVVVHVDDRARALQGSSCACVAATDACDQAHATKLALAPQAAAHEYFDVMTKLMLRPRLRACSFQQHMDGLRHNCKTAF